MSNHNDKLIIVYFVVSLIVMCTLACLLYVCEKKCKNSKENICICSKGKKMSASREERLASYNNGNTEYQDFAKQQKLARSC